MNNQQHNTASHCTLKLHITLTKKKKKTSLYKGFRLGSFRRFTNTTGVGGLFAWPCLPHSDLRYPQPMRFYSWVQGVVTNVLPYCLGLLESRITNRFSGLHSDPKQRRFLFRTVQSSRLRDGSKGLMTICVFILVYFVAFLLIVFRLSTTCYWLGISSFI